MAETRAQTLAWIVNAEKGLMTGSVDRERLGGIRSFVRL